MSPFNLLIFVIVALLTAPHLTLASNEVQETSSKAYFFPPPENGILNHISELSYAISDDQRSIQIGPVEYNHESLSAQFIRLNENELILLVKWPEELIPHGELVWSQRGKASKWKLIIDEASIKNWENQRAKIELPAALKKITENYKFGHRMTLKEVATQLPVGKPFQFCFRGAEDHQACSSANGIARRGTEIQIRRLAQKLRPGVIINSKPAPQRGVFPNENAKEKTDFRVRLITGATYQFKSQSADLGLMDVIYLKDEGQILLRGQGNPPFGDVRITEKDPEITPLMDRSLYPTPNPVWNLRLSTEDPFLYFRGKQGGVFRHPVFFDRIPTAEHRAESTGPRLVKTYSANPRIEIQPPKSGTIEVTDGQRMESRNSESNIQLWELKDAPKGKVKNYSLLINDGSSNYTAHIPVYRGYPYEFGGILGGAAQIDSLAIAGEARAYAWFETFLGCRNKYLCHQRWGARAKYFQSSSLITIGENSSALTTTNIQTDLYFRLSQGLWGVDEFVGLIMGMQNLSLNEYSASSLGVGLTWGRSLPLVLQQIFDIAPFMRYPKWVHMDFTYYPVSLDDNIQLGRQVPNWTLNFQGRVLWTEKVYGEVGFGTYSTDFVVVDQQRNIVSSALFGTMGLGIRF